MDNRTKLFSAIFHNEGIHIRELSRLLDIGLPTIDHHLKKMEKEGIVKKVSEGRNVKLYVDFSTLSVIPQLYCSEYSRLTSLPAHARGAIVEYMKSLECKPILTIVFGSYARGAFTRKSDVDVLLVFDKPEREDIENKARAVRYKYGVDVSVVYMKYAEFKDKFYNEKDAFMKELKKSKIIVQGIEWWVLLENEK
ncbi:MAG: nucleotidyltransferase domain-containing protein [archaeon]|nr:nucleotidyltransferase domain-containing protein [archaeon]